MNKRKKMPETWHSNAKRTSAEWMLVKHGPENSTVNMAFEFPLYCYGLITKRLHYGL